MKFSEHFKLGKEQAELDFVDVDPACDLGSFVDPYAIEIKDDQWSAECGDHIRSFFDEVLTALRKNDERRARYLVAHLHEPKETYLGLSAGKPQGRGVGTLQGDLILQALRKSVAFKTGLLSDLAEAELFIEGIGRDKLSGLTTNVIRGPLCEYTKTQCNLHGITTRPVATAAAWSRANGRWEARYAELPLISRKPVMLVPKYSVRWRLSLDSQEFYNHHMIEYLQSEYQHGASGLVEVLRSGRRRVCKKDVKRRHPFIKDELAKFVIEHPEVLETYKMIKGARGSLGNTDFDEDFDERAFADSLKDRLARIPSGDDSAGEYHSLMTGILTFIFYPDLICPVKEQRLHEGRKRVDCIHERGYRRLFLSGIGRSTDAKHTRSRRVQELQLRCWQSRARSA